jgi:hypothetical protein
MVPYSQANGVSVTARRQDAKVSLDIVVFKTPKTILAGSKNWVVVWIYRNTLKTDFLNAHLIVKIVS